MQPLDNLSNEIAQFAEMATAFLAVGIAILIILCALVWCWCNRVLSLCDLLRHRSPKVGANDASFFVKDCRNNDDN